MCPYASFQVKWKYTTGTKTYTQICHYIKTTDRLGAKVPPAKGWDIFGSKWTVSFRKWCVRSRKSGKCKTRADFELNFDGLAAGSEHLQNGNHPVVMFLEFYIVPKQCCPRKDTWWINDKVLGTQGSLMQVRMLVQSTRRAIAPKNAGYVHAGCDKNDITEYACCDWFDCPCWFLSLAVRTYNRNMSIRTGL